jgi:hypothetical protein
MPPKKTVSALIASLGGGELNDVASEKLREINQALGAKEAPQGATASLTITLKFKKDKRTIGVTGTAKPSIPAPTCERSTFFIDSDHHLTEEDPKQLSLLKDNPKVKAGLVPMNGGRNRAAGDDNNPNED